MKVQRDQLYVYLRKVKLDDRGGLHGTLRKKYSKEKFYKNMFFTYKNMYNSVKSQK